MIVFTPALIGKISLNSAFILYLCVYLPQIMHNRAANHLAHLSLKTHYLLYAGYLLDLLYGFSMHLQWQYKTVSMVGFSLLLIQHLQLTKAAWVRKKRTLVRNNVVCLLTTVIFMIYFFTQMQAVFSEKTTFVLGFISRTCFILYLLPQIIKNRTTASAHALSVTFVSLNLLLSLLDMISAWCLDWGWPNKLAAPFSVTLMLILLRQFRKYAPLFNAKNR